MSRELHGIFRRRGIPADEASDLAQETIVRTLVHLKRHGRSRDDVRPLVHTIARNLLVTRVRRRQPELVSLTTDEELVDDTRQPLDEIIVRERREAVRNALGSLAPRHRRVVAMWMDGMTPAQIARELGIKRNAVDALLHRARRRLASKLEPGSASLGLVAFIFTRIRGITRRVTDAVGSLDPSGSLTQVTTGLAAASLATVLLVTGSMTPSDERPSRVRKVELTRVSVGVGAAVSRSEEGVRVVRQVDPVQAPDVHYRMRTATTLKNPATGEEEETGLELDYTPGDGGGTLDPLLEPAVERACEATPSICIK